MSAWGRNAVQQKKERLFDHFVGERHKSFRQLDTGSLRGLEVDEQLVSVSALQTADPPAGCHSRYVPFSET